MLAFAPLIFPSLRVKWQDRSLVPVQDVLLLYRSLLLSFNVETPGPAEAELELRFNLSKLPCVTWCPLHCVGEAASCLWAGLLCAGKKYLNVPFGFGQVRHVGICCPGKSPQDHLCNLTKAAPPWTSWCVS